MRHAIDKFEQKAIDDVRAFGIHVIAVGEDSIGPGFVYSIGLFETYAHPEIIIVGLRQELAHSLLNNMAADIKQGRTFNSQDFHDGVLDGFVCYFGDVKRELYEDYVGWDIWFYDGENFPLVQCVYPTVLGKFPWDKDFPEDSRWFCPMLTAPPIVV